MNTETVEKRYPYQDGDRTLWNKLNPLETFVMLEKGTERPFTGVYDQQFTEGTYYCRQCDSPLYSSSSKFDAGCGWPSFDDEIPHAVTRVTDADGMRVEILCSVCNAHLGHVFTNEGFTPTNTRHCVNSTSLDFRSGPPVAKAHYAGGCFWGVEHLLQQKKGVYSVISGYAGGTTEQPTYQQVLSQTTGHLESVEVRYNPLEISYEELTKYFLEIHDPYQTDGQGPDIGSQYLSAIFYKGRYEYEVAVKLLTYLESGSLRVATQLRPDTRFWEAEEYHQNYYERLGTLPYCHMWAKRF